MVFDDVEEVKGDKATLTGWLYVDVRDYRKTLEYIDDVLVEKMKKIFFGETRIKHM